MTRPFVTAIVPCRDEASFIRPCIDSLLATDYAADRLEIIVVDGMSTDGTRDALVTYAGAGIPLRILDNERRIIPAAMNIGIRAAKGEIVLKIDAHSTYPRNYISKCVERLQESGADNVGGVLVTTPAAATATAAAIAIGLSHPFGSGNSRFRIGVSEPIWSDTAAFGCYRREVFERIGLYNEKLVRSSDMDLNARLCQAGGRILLAPDIIAHYYPRGRLGEFLGRNLIDGFWALYPLRFGSRLVRLRHLVPLLSLIVFTLAVVLAIAGVRWRPLPIALLGGYVVVSLAVAAIIAVRKRSPALLGLLPLVFLLRHGGYAVGSLWGLLRVLAGREFWIRPAITSRPITAKP